MFVYLSIGMVIGMFQLNATAAHCFKICEKYRNHIQERNDECNMHMSIQHWFTDTHQAVAITLTLCLNVNHTTCVVNHRLYTTCVIMKVTVQLMEYDIGHSAVNVYHQQEMLYVFCCDLWYITDCCSTRPHTKNMGIKFSETKLKYSKAWLQAQGAVTSLREERVLSKNSQTPENNLLVMGAKFPPLLFCFLFRFYLLIVYLFYLLFVFYNARYLLISDFLSKAVCKTVAYNALWITNVYELCHRHKLALNCLETEL